MSAPALILLALALLALVQQTLASSSTIRLSIKSYGAVGDGVHDDTQPVFDAIIDVINTAAPGQPVELVFEPGVYLLASVPTVGGSGPRPLPVYGYMYMPPQENVSYSIVGAGSELTKFLYAPQNGTLLELQENRGYVNDATVNGSSFTFSGFTVEWSTSNVNGTSYSLCYSRWYQDILIHDVVFNGYQPFDSTVSIFDLNGDAAASLQMSDVTSTNSNTFLNCGLIGSVSINSTTITNTQSGIVVYTVGTEMSLQIDDMTQTNVAVGVYLNMEIVDSDPYPPTIINATITNSVFSVTQNLNSFQVNEAIIQSSPGLLFVDSCTFSDSLAKPTRVHIDSVIGNATIVNSKFNGGSSAFYPAGWYWSGGPSASSNLKISGNTFNGPWTSASSVALDASGTTSVTVEDNLCLGGGSILFNCTGAAQVCIDENNQGCTISPATSKIQLI